MAEGGLDQHRSFKITVSDKSLCEPCRGEGQSVTAEGYCPLCGEYLCETCLCTHRKLKITRNHAIVNIKQIPDGYSLQYYCKSHDELHCNDCMTPRFIACQKVKSQDVSKKSQAIKELQLITMKLHEFHIKVKMLEVELEDGLKNLDTTYDNILHKVTDVRKQLNEYLDQIEKQIKDEAKQMNEQDKSDMKILIAVNESVKLELENILHKMRNGDNITSISDITNNAKQSLVVLEQEFDKIKESLQQQHQQQCEFVTSHEIENIITTKPTLGRLFKNAHHENRSMKDTRSTIKHPIIDTTATDRGSIVNTIATYRENMNVKTAMDKNQCWINDCTLLSPDKLVVTDTNNHMVKLIDLNNNTVISSYTTYGTPSKVTSTRADQVAVTQPNERTIQLLHVTSKFTKSHDIQVNNGCYGVAYKEKKFAVSYIDPGRVDILNFHGKVLHTIKPKQGKYNTQHEPFFIAFGERDGTVIVSDSLNNKVSMVTFEGQILSTYTNDALMFPRGIVMSEGVLFICSWGSGCIHVVSRDFKTSKIIISDNNVLNPRGITYCDVNHRLYISNYVIGGGDIYNKVQVYDVKL